MCSYTFFEYVDAIRLGNLVRFKELERECEGWWFPTLDRGAGALLHFAADHGRFEAVKYLLETKKVPINQLDKQHGWTPLHRCARMVHYRHAPYMEIFEYLLQRGADPNIKSRSSPGYSELGYPQVSTPLDLVVKKGFEWNVGEVREKLAALISKYAHVPKAPAWEYTGPPQGQEATRVLEVWKRLPKLYPPDNWRPPPPPGYVGSPGWRVHAISPWRPAGDDDGSCWLRPMTPEELEEQGRRC